MDKIQLKEKVNKISEVVKRNYEADGEVTLCMFIFARINGKETTGVVPLIGNSILERRREVIFSLGKNLTTSLEGLESVDAIAMCGGVWASTVAKEEVEKEALSGKYTNFDPAKDPNRQEMVIIQAVTAQGEKENRLWTVETQGGKKVLKENNMLDTVADMGDNEDSRLLTSFWNGYYGLKAK